MKELGISILVIYHEGGGKVELEFYIYNTPVSPP